MTDISRIPGTPKAISAPCVLCLKPAVHSPDCEIRLNSALLLKEVNHMHCDYEGNPQQGVPNTTQDRPQRMEGNLFSLFIDFTLTLIYT